MAAGLDADATSTAAYRSAGCPGAHREVRVQRLRGALAHDHSPKPSSQRTAAAATPHLASPSTYLAPLDFLP